MRAVLPRDGLQPPQWMETRLLATIAEKSDVLKSDFDLSHGEEAPQEFHSRDYVPSGLWIPHKGLLKVAGKGIS